MKGGVVWCVFACVRQGTVYLNTRHKDVGKKQ